MPFPTHYPRRSRALNSADRGDSTLAQPFTPAEGVKSAPHLWSKERDRLLGNFKTSGDQHWGWQLTFWSNFSDYFVGVTLASPSSCGLLLSADLFQITHESTRRKHAVTGLRANAKSAARVESAPELVGDGALTAGIETRNGLKIAVTTFRLEVRPAGFEPATLCLEGRCSIRLSYGRTLSVVASHNLARRRPVSKAV
jgi:hypothetical protein